ncbi:MAG: hypothetical protein M0Q91_07650 [Methanoregula sp.]|jgi:hypothetical protein|nr:hypothetical protein [Methanoregula sp.]
MTTLTAEQIPPIVEILWAKEQAEEELKKIAYTPPKDLELTIEGDIEALKKKIESERSLCAKEGVSRKEYISKIKPLKDSLVQLIAENKRIIERNNAKITPVLQAVEAAKQAVVADQESIRETTAKQIEITPVSADDIKKTTAEP